MIQAKINPVPILAMLVLGAALAIVASCGKGMPDPSYIQSPDGNLVVDNTNKNRFVLFRGSPSKETYIGGVPAHASGFKLKTGPGKFVLIGITVEHYMQNIKNVTEAPIQFSAVVDLGSERKKVGIVPILIGKSRLVMENQCTEFVAIEFVSVEKNGKDVTNRVFMAPLENRVQMVPVRDFRIYPYILVNGRMKALSNSFVLIGTYLDTTNRIVVKPE